MKTLFIALSLMLAAPMVAAPVATTFMNVAYADSVSSPAPVAAASPVADAAPVIVIPAAPAAPLSYVQMVVNYLETIPAVGKILSTLFQVLAMLSVGLTALATLLIGVQGALTSMGKKIPVLALVAGYIAALIPWVKYLSMYNQPPAPPAA